MPGQPFTGRLAGSRAAADSLEKRKKLKSLSGIKPWTFEAIHHSLTAILAELSKLLGKCVMMTTARLLPTCAEKQRVTVWHII